MPLRTSRVARARVPRVMQCCRVSLCAGVIVVLSAAGAGATTWKTGDVFAGVNNGSYKVYTNSGVYKETVTTGGSYTTGCAFNGARDHLYATNFGESRLVVYETLHPHASVAIPTASTSPESLVFMSNGDFLVGYAGGGGAIGRFDASGQAVATYTAATENVGTDWIELAADQKTLFYTSEGIRIMRYDIEAKAQLADFTSVPAGYTLFALRLLPPGDGSAGLLVAGRGAVLRLDSTGAIVQTYAVDGEDGWFSLNLDPNGTSFWAGSFSSDNLYRFNISSGAVEVGPINTSGSSRNLYGVCVLGEITSGVESICDDNVDNDGDDLVDCADPDCAGDPACSLCGNGILDEGEQCDPADTEDPCPAQESCLSNCVCGCADNFDCDDEIDCTVDTCDLGTGACTHDASQCGCPGECGDPAEEFGVITAVDAAYILRTSVDLQTCEPCVCDLDHSGEILANDALADLVYAVGLPAALECPTEQ